MHMREEGREVRVLTEAGDGVHATEYNSVRGGAA
jgi:hypothetical protein